MTEDMFETLIDTEGTKNFMVKEGANTAIFEFGHKPEPQPEYHADVNNDGAVDSADISSVISVMAGTAEYDGADVNNDGAVDSADISAIITVMASSARLQRMLEGAEK